MSEGLNQTNKTMLTKKQKASIIILIGWALQLGIFYFLLQSPIGVEQKPIDPTFTAFMWVLFVFGVGSLVSTTVQHIRDK